MTPEGRGDRPNTPATPPRRTLLAASLLAPTAMALAACAEDRPPPGPAPVEDVGVPVPAPSGEVTAVIDTAGDTLGVVLRDAQDADFWADDFPYDPDSPPGLVWEQEADVLWVLSEDRGTARIAQDADGTWTQQPAAELDEEIPAEIARWQ